MTEAEEGSQVLGEVGTLNKRARLLIPAALRKATPWLQGKDPIALIAELVPDRHLRFHPACSAESLLQQLRQRIVEEYGPESDHLAALVDRYRSVTFYPSDSQVHLGETVATHIQPPPPVASQYFYIETVGHHINVMTLEHRDLRLERLQDELALKPSE